MNLQANGAASLSEEDLQVAARQRFSRIYVPQKVDLVFDLVYQLVMMVWYIKSRVSYYAITGCELNRQQGNVAAFVADL